MVVNRFKVLILILTWTVVFGLFSGLAVATAAEAQSFKSNGCAHQEIHRFITPATLHEAPANIAPESMMGASIGTAWPIESGHVITNNHVVMDSSEVILVDRSGRELRAWTVLRDEMHDIAFLKVEDVRQLPPALPLARETAEEGSKVFTIGFPRIDVMGTSPKFTEGVISNLKGVNDDPASYQTTVPIQPGNSGGPLINMRGEVVGVVKSMIGYRDEAKGTLYVLENASCALKIEGVKELFSYLPQEGMQLQTLPRSDEQPAALFDRIEHSMLIVVAR